MRLTLALLVVGVAACAADEASLPLDPTRAEAHSATAQFSPSWQVVDYGDGGQSAELFSVNASGVAVGLRRVGQSSKAVMTRNGQLVDIALPRLAVNASADDINDAGEIVGAYKIGYTRYAYHRSAKGLITVLPSFQGDTWQRAWALNEAGQVVGNAADHGAAVLWSRTSKGTWTVTDLGEIDVGSFSDALDINDRGWVVGRTEAGGYVRGFVKKPGRPMQALGTLDGRAGTSTASGINTAGTVVGVSSGGATGGITFRWTSASGMINLTSSHPLDRPSINDHGRVAANGVVNQFFTNAFTLKGGILTYLPPHARGAYTTAHRINACGTIAGSSGTHAVLWKPVAGNPPVPVCD